VTRHDEPARAACGRLELARLFESTHPADHAEAAEYCRVCPAIEACRELLAEVLDPGPGGAYRGVQGTWAGLHFGLAGHPRPKVEETG
jgi:hypothetical protein